MDERIIVYKDPELNNWVNRYQWMRGQLQSLADGIKSLGITPTDELLHRLLNGESIEDMVAQKSINGYMEDLPKSLLKTISDLFVKERKEDYAEAVGNKIASIIDWRKRNEATSMVNFKYFHISNGSVEIAPEYMVELERYYCVFVDTDTKRAIYEKWQQLQTVRNQGKSMRFD